MRRSARRGKVLKKWMASGLAMLALSACGGGGRDFPFTGGINQPFTGTAQFIDSAVKGLAYTSGELVGVTDADGAFDYAAGKPVIFSVGNTVIGQVTLERSDNSLYITPVDLVADAEAETDTSVANIARLLQSLDDDRDAENGITITEAMHAAADEDIDISALSNSAFQNYVSYFETLMALGSSGITDLVTAADAQAHLKSVLLERLAGTYQGTFTDTEDNSGTFTLTVDASGEITGTAIDDEGQSSTLSGQTSSDRSAVVDGSDIGVEFSGRISKDGVFSGVWENVSLGESGAFTGTRQ
ncbi:MAG: hypothetical protein P8176_11235 [Gammaproteobacteria bacterium]